MKIYTLFQMTRRNILIYLKDKANIFFSLLSPLIILGLYILFIGKLQIDGLNGALTKAGIEGGEKAVRAFCDSWMLTGVMAVACITVALCSSGVMVADRQRGILNDTAAAPIPKWLVTVSYFLSVALVTFVICIIILCICFVYLAVLGNFYLSFVDVLGCIVVTLLSVLSSTMVVVLIASFMKTEGAFSGVNVIMGTMIGFIIGAYMPISTFPKAVQYFTLFIPGSYSAGLFRQFFMGGALDQLGKVAPQEMVEALGKDYSMSYDFFGVEIKTAAMWIILACTVVVFLGINLLILHLHSTKQKN